jgi:PhzF family phenazine biosynthesis protein
MAKGRPRAARTRASSRAQNPRRPARPRRARAAAPVRARATHAPAPKRPAKGHRASAAKRARNSPLRPGTTRLPIFQVDAFTRRPFHGNPAAVVLLGSTDLDDTTLQNIAAENNLAETAFIRPRPLSHGVPHFNIRWFTPSTEVDLCGHATLAAAHVLWRHATSGMSARGNRIIFESRAGELVVDREGDLIVLDFPAQPGQQMPIDPALSAALGAAPTECYRSDAGKIMAVFDNRREVYGLTPDMIALAKLDGLGVIATAPGSGHDFVSRFFAPRLGIPEDPVTGSAHCTLIPYWSDRLGKKRLNAHQVSKRGGELACEDRGTRVRIGGFAVTIVEGTLLVG